MSIRENRLAQINIDASDFCSKCRVPIGMGHCSGCESVDEDEIDYDSGDFVEDVVEVTCDGCGIDFHVPRWQYEEDIQYENVFACEDCSPPPDEARMEVIQ